MEHWAKILGHLPNGNTLPLETSKKIKRTRGDRKMLETKKYYLAKDNYQQRFLCKFCWIIFCQCFLCYNFIIQVIQKTFFLLLTWFQWVHAYFIIRMTLYWNIPTRIYVFVVSTKMITSKIFSFFGIWTYSQRISRIHSWYTFCWQRS